jgi:DNA-binding protein H-NS
MSQTEKILEKFNERMKELREKRQSLFSEVREQIDSSRIKELKDELSSQ